MQDSLTVVTDILSADELLEHPREPLERGGLEGSGEPEVVAPTGVWIAFDTACNSPMEIHLRRPEAAQLLTSGRGSGNICNPLESQDGQWMPGTYTCRGESTSSDHRRTRS